MAARTAWRLCRQNGWHCAFGAKRGKNGRRPGPPVHDDRVRRDFSAEAPNRLWLTDITEHPTGEGKLYLCAIKDVHAGRIVGYSMAGRMQASLAGNALEQHVAAREQGDEQPLEHRVLADDDALALVQRRLERVADVARGIGLVRGGGHGVRSSGSGRVRAGAHAGAGT